VIHGLQEVAGVGYKAWTNDCLLLLASCQSKEKAQANNGTLHDAASIVVRWMTLARKRHLAGSLRLA
jgi:hypothetical protein